MLSRNRKLKYSRNLKYISRSYNISQAFANIKGSIAYPNITGKVKFYEKENGILVKIEVKGLPSQYKNNFFGFHLHEFGICNDNSDKKSFLEAGSHFDIEENKHPNHSGDFPSIYSNDGYAYMEFFTNRFKIKDIIGKSVIIHEMKDDFMTDPSGNSGSRIACGIITENFG